MRVRWRLGMVRVFCLVLVIALGFTGCTESIDKPATAPKNNNTKVENAGFYHLKFNSNKYGESRECSVLWGTSSYSVGSGGLTNGQNVSEAAAEYTKLNMQISYIPYDAELSISTANNLLIGSMQPYIERDENCADYVLFEVSDCPAIKAQYFWDDVNVEYMRVLILTRNHCYNIVQYRNSLEMSNNPFVELENLIAEVEIGDMDKFVGREDTPADCEHSISETILKEPTETAVGIKQYSCTKCDYSYTEDIPMLEPTLPEETKPNRAEILFREIPWRATSEESKKMLEQSDSSVSATIWKNTFIYYPNALLKTNSFDGVYGGGNIIYAYKLTAGGYNVQSAQLYFAYDIQDETIDRDADSLYAAVYYLDVVEFETVYKDLQKKLSDLYGNGKEKISTESGWIVAGDYSGSYLYTVKQITWYGYNNTFVTLQWRSSSNQAESIQGNCGISLLYGIQNADAVLDKLEIAIEKENADQDRDNAEGNLNGL